MINSKRESENNHIPDSIPILDKISEGVLLLNPLGSITFANMSFQELVGYSQKELDGLGFEQFIEFLRSELSATEAKAHWHNIINGVPTVLKLIIKHRENYLIPVEVDASVRYDKAGEMCGVLLICRDLHSELLLQITQTITSSLKLDEVLENIITVVVDYLGLASTAVFLWDKKTDCLRLSCCNVYKDKTQIPIVEIPLGFGAPGMIAQRREPVYVHNLGETELVNQINNDYKVREKLDNRSSIGYPLIYRNQLLGVIAFDAANIREFSSTEKRIFEIISSQVAMAIYNAELYSEVEHQSITDGLTGLYNHRYFEKRIQDESIRATSVNSCFCLIVLDIDHFKNYNDKLGHLQGNKALVEFAELVKHSVRSFDVVCRFGGDEFAVILPECNISDAAMVAERIRKACEEHNFFGKEYQPPVKLTTSIGIASSIEAKTVKELFTMADNALYNAKMDNSNKVVIAQSYLAH